MKKISVFAWFACFFLAVLGLLGAGSSLFATGGPQAVHPGSWITQVGCDRIRQNVAAGREPWKSAWAALEKGEAQPDYRPNGDGKVTNGYAMQNDGHAAWVLAVKWVASGQAKYAEGAKRILDAWAVKESVPDDTLRTGLGATQMINAAELIRHANKGAAGWAPAKAEQFAEFCRAKVLPVVRQNGGGGWGTPCLSALVAMGVYCDDAAIYKLGREMLMENRRETDPGCDKSCLREYIFDNGQNGDSYRDQGHSMGALAHLGEAAETCANQGDLSVWKAYDNLLLKGYEYVAKYNLGEAVEFIPYTDGNGHRKTSISNAGRVSDGKGAFSPMFEMAYHRFLQLGLACPYTKRVRDGYAPEGTNSDNCGMGTLIFTTDPVRK